MKHSLSLLALFTACFGFILSLTSCSPAFNGQDEEAIRNLVMEETFQFFARDYQGWADTFVPASNAFQIWNNADGSYTHAMGWETISTNVRAFIEDNPDPDTTPLRFDNFSIRPYGEAAFVTYDKFMGEGVDVKPVKEIRIVEKYDGVWKIVCVAAFVDYTTPAETDDMME